MKNLVLIILVSLFLNGCFQVVALVGPAITGASTGNITQSLVSYSLSYGVKQATGKTIIENALDINKRKKIVRNVKNQELKNSLLSEYSQ